MAEKRRRLALIASKGSLICLPPAHTGHYGGEYGVGGGRFLYLLCPGYHP